MKPTRNIGRFTRLNYDKDSILDNEKQLSEPLSYILDTNKIYNKNECFTTFGPSTSYMGNSVPVLQNMKDNIAASQQLVDVETILKNINVKTEKTRRGHVNPIDVTKWDTKSLKNCVRNLEVETSRLQLPPSSFREMAINRFYDLPKNPQENIFYDFAMNTRLEAKDNYVLEQPKLWHHQYNLNETTPKKHFFNYECNKNTNLFTK